MNKPTPTPICEECGKRPAPYGHSLESYCKDHVPPLKIKIVGRHPHAGERGTLYRANTAMKGKMAYVELDNCAHANNGCYVERDNVELIDTRPKAAM